MGNGNASPARQRDSNNHTPSRLLQHVEQEACQAGDGAVRLDQTFSPTVVFVELSDPRTVDTRLRRGVKFRPVPSWHCSLALTLDVTAHDDKFNVNVTQNYYEHLRGVRPYDL